MIIRPGPSWFVGTTGFSYPEWAKTLYARSRGSPAGGHRLTRFAAHFNAVEINTTFYGIPSSDTVRSWLDVTPPAFGFTIKMPRDVTHGPTPPGAKASPDGPPPGHLLEQETLLTARRLIAAVRPLGDKLRAVLLQFPPKFVVARRDELATFLDRLGPAAPLAVEFRHDSWWTPETQATLRDRSVCWVATDEAPQHEAEHAPGSEDGDRRAPRPIMVTADFLYIRWLGRHDQFEDRTRERFDPTPRLRWWTERLRHTIDTNPRIRAVYGFFDNDYVGHAPHTARRFMDMIGLSSQAPDPPATDEPLLFG